MLFVGGDVVVVGGGVVVVGGGSGKRRSELSWRDAARR